MTLPSALRISLPLLGLLVIVPREFIGFHGFTQSLRLLIIENGRWEMVQGVRIDAISREKIVVSIAELKEERDAVRSLIPG